ncbi:MAG TPA: hypothetical protein VJJ52_07125 [Candidatus Nanoarchaeia archaeon]|nr:hypothetical protein [Candidatus Nanoarchaeia archaeon]
MKVSIDTKEDSHEEIKKVIKMLQNLVGDSQEIFSNDASVAQTSNASPIANIFGDNIPVSSSSELLSSSETTASQVVESEVNSPSSAEAKEEISQSTEDLFAELFSEEELKKMEPVKAPEDEDEEEEIKSKEKSKSKRPDIEFY